VAENRATRSTGSSGRYHHLILPYSDAVLSALSHRTFDGVVGGYQRVLKIHSGVRPGVIHACDAGVGFNTPVSEVQPDE